MAVNLWLGLLLTLVAGLLSGNCMLPMKFARRWPWENTWLVISIVSRLRIHRAPRIRRRMGQRSIRRVRHMGLSPGT